MPQITIDGRVCDFEKGEMILQVANRQGIAIPQYCYHDGLSIVASCRICLAEVWAPNPRNDNKLEPIPKLLPTCQTPAADGQVVYTTSPKAIANQKAVMEYLLINHPLDCPVCDQSGECFLQDYSYEYGRGVSRFEESKVKQPKKNLGPHIYLYADRCIMCSRCVRFCREVTGTAEITISGRGNTEQIDVFPGIALDNELSANVVDLCPVGALLDKDFLFAQRVWFLKSTPSIDGITAQGDNIFIDHNQGAIYRVKPRTNHDVNKWWISDEIRYGWKFVHREDRLSTPTHVRHHKRVPCDFTRAYEDILERTRGQHIALMVSPMLSCEDAFNLATLARRIDPDAVLAVGPIPYEGEDKTFPGGYTIRAEKAPNARGVRRVLEAVAGEGAVPSYNDLLPRLNSKEFQAVLVTGNYPSEWITPELENALRGTFTVLIDTLPNRMTGEAGADGGADVVLPGATWAEKAGTFENADNRLQAFEQAIPVQEGARSESQIALDLIAILDGTPAHMTFAERIVQIVDEQPGQVPAAEETYVPLARLYNAADTRQRMADRHPALNVFITDVKPPGVEVKQEPDMEVVEL